MKKTIEINGIECNFKSSAAVPRIYRLKFGRDIFIDLTKIEQQVKQQEKRKKELQEQAEREGLEFDESQFESELPIESLEMFENIAYIMHKHGDKDQPDDIDSWLEQFETFDIYQILPEILELWNKENMQMSHAKKKNGK